MPKFNNIYTIIKIIFLYLQLYFPVHLFILKTFLPYKSVQVLIIMNVVRIVVVRELALMKPENWKVLF